MKLYTSKQAAKMLGKNREVVERACKRLEIDKLSGRYVITPAVISLLKKNIKKVGNPGKKV